MLSLPFKEVLFFVCKYILPHSKSVLLDFVAEKQKIITAEHFGVFCGYLGNNYKSKLILSFLSKLFELFRHLSFFGVRENSEIH